MFRCVPGSGPPFVGHHQWVDRMFRCSAYWEQTLHAEIFGVTAAKASKRAKRTSADDVAVLPLIQNKGKTERGCTSTFPHWD
jgi:hypothetical protein